MDNKLKSMYEGLDSNEVAKRVSAGKTNASSNDLTRSIWSIFSDNLFTLFNGINLVLAILILYTGSYRNLLFLGIVVLNTAISIFQEIRAKRQTDRLVLLTEDEVEVVRDGRGEFVHQDDIVQDDLIYLKRGFQIPVDGVVVSDSILEVDESLLTGEAKVIRKNLNDEVVSGSFIVGGQAYIKATKVGNETFVSKLAAQAKNETRTSSELLNTINKIIGFLTIVIIPVGILLFVSGILHGLNTNIAILGTSAAMLGMIPEGLVLLTTVTLAVGAIHLMRQRVLVRTLPAIESLARSDILCLDKTGTITTGNLQFDRLDIQSEHTREELGKIISALMFTLNDDNETALILKSTFPENPGWESTKILPFSSGRKSSGADFGEKGAYLIGSPDFVMNNIDEKVEEQISGYTRVGRRVLALVRVQGSLKEQDNKTELLGLIVITDEIRPDAVETFKFFEEQNVILKVISGDNPETVSYIAQSADIKNADKFVDMKEKEGKEDYLNLVKTYSVFGHVNPTQKMYLVGAYQELGHTVAMTGDGVNDVLALRQADCGIAMSNGSEATKSIADFILLDSNFSVMKNVVQQGRKVVNNIEKVASLYLVKTTYSVFLSIIFIFLGGGYPYTPVQLIPISILGIGIPSFFLALENNYARIAGSFIKKVSRTALSGGLTIVILTVTIELLSKVQEFSYRETSTLVILVIGITSFIVLSDIAKTLKAWKVGLITILVAIFFILITVFRNFFMLSSIWQMNEAVIYVPLILISYPLYRGIGNLFEKLDISEKVGKIKYLNK